MQAIDDRESRLRMAFRRLENEEGKIPREAIINLVTVRKKIIKCKIFEVVNILDEGEDADDPCGG